MSRLNANPNCPNCGILLTGYGEKDLNTKPGRHPIPGDLTVCAYCETVLTYIDDGRGLRLQQIEIATLNPEERADIESAMKTMRQFGRFKQRSVN